MGNSSTSQSYSSQDDNSLRTRIPPRQPLDDLRDIKFDPPEFEGSLNPNLYLKWVQSLERLFEIQECSEEKVFMLVVLKLQEYTSFGLKTSYNKGTKKASLGSDIGTN